jgi:hypothetical protein
MRTTTEANTDRAEQLEALGFTGEEDYAAHQRVTENMRVLAQQQLQGSRTSTVQELVHLSETGVNAGRRLCLAPRDESSRSVHAMYAPLGNPTFRASVCLKCLEVWATEAYEDGENMPLYIAEARAAAMQQPIQPSLDSNNATGGQ